MKKLLTVFLALLLAGCGTPPAVQASAVYETRTLPVLMYHSVLKDPERTGDYVISPDKLESDIAWLIAHGYETVTPSEVGAFVTGCASLPEKPVVLTFDDGYLNNLTYVLPLLERYDCRAAIAVVGAYSERFSESPDPNPGYAHLTWDDIIALNVSDRVEIMHHSYDMHGLNGRRGSGRREGESDAAYRRAFTEDTETLSTMLREHCGIVPAFYAYPFGEIGAGSAELLMEMGFTGAFTCREKTNTVTVGDTAGLFTLGRFNRKGQPSTETFMRTIGLDDDARATEAPSRK